MFEKFAMKEIVFLALFSVVLLLVSSLIMPLVMFTQIFALRQVFASAIFAFFCTIALMKIPKPGTLTLIGILTGAVLGFMAPIMLINNVLAAMAAELLMLLFFRGYGSDLSKWLTAAIYVPLTLPLTLLFTALMKDISLNEQLQAPWLSLALMLLTLLLGLLGARFGLKIGYELKKAGKIL